jgi:hypothetical protein
MKAVIRKVVVLLLVLIIAGLAYIDCQGSLPIRGKNQRLQEQQERLREQDQQEQHQRDLKARSSDPRS